MKSVLLVIALLMCGTAQAGVYRHFLKPVALGVTYPLRVSPIKLMTPPVLVVTYPVRHPVKTFRPLVFPVVHPKRFWVWDTTPQCAPCPDFAHGPTLPPDPWSDWSVL